MESVEKRSGDPGIRSLWIPVTPAKAILSRAGKVVAAKLPVNELDDGTESENEYPPGFEPKVQPDESEEDYPPGFEPLFRSAESDLSYDVRFSVLESTRREDGKLVAGDSGGGEGYGVSPTQSVCSVAGFDMSLLTKANAVGVQGRCESVSGGHARTVSCSCLDCNLEHPGTWSLISHQDDSFPGAFSASNICKGLGKRHLPLDQSQFSEIVPLLTVADEVTKETSPPLAPATSHKAGGLQRRNSETENWSACDQTNRARGLSEEPIKESQHSTAKNQVDDKGDTQGIELRVDKKGHTQGIELKTPLKKERRKKHRPKVVNEVKVGMKSIRKQTTSETGVSRDDSKPKNKYVQRRGTENAQRASLEGRHDSTNLETAQSQPEVKPCQRNLKDDAEGEANANLGVENPTLKRKYVQREKGVDDANTTTTLTQNLTRKSCRRGLNFESEVPTKKDKATEVTTKYNGAGNNKNDDCPNLVAACSSFPFRRRKRTRTQLSPSTVSDETKLSSDYKDGRATGTKRDDIPWMTETVMSSVQDKFEYFQGVVSTGKAAGTATMTYSNSYRSHCNSIQAHRYWALSLSNLQNKFTVNDGRYTILEADHSAADFGLTGRPATAHIQDPCLFPSHDNSSLISCLQESSIHFPGEVRLTGLERACSVQVAGATSSEMSNNRIPAGSYPEFVRNSSSGIKDLVKQLRKLNLNKERAVRKDQMHRLVPSYDLMYQQDNALVLYKPAGMIVPYGNPPNKPKKQSKRVKVELDDETNKVWQLLLENIDNERINGTDEEKAKWWEEERAVFQGRADSFIARMRLVQGDRRFSLWKGSVVDSVVGVFLTQNVSDHLSSSAFMSLAARYPLKTSQNSSSVEATDGKEANAEGKSMTSFTKLLNLANNCIPNGLFIREKIGGVQSDEHSPSPNEESKHDFPGLLHHYGETSKIIPSSQCSAGMNNNIPTQERKSLGKKEQQKFDWDGLRKEAEAHRRKTETPPLTTDSLDWESVRRAPASEVASIIRKRGMNYRLSQRIKDFLDRVVRDHGRLDLEWLRDIPPDKAKEYLLSFQGLGPKSVDCVRLLTLHHLAFPVDINVGRIAVRLGWVALQPLPESLQLHLLEMYPILESIQQYLWPRLCKLDQGTLYELHYQMITFGKVFCTKNKPNCNSCPMRGECRHFASAFASARLALPAPEQSSRDCVTEKDACVLNPPERLSLPSPPEKLEVLDIEDLARKCKRSSCKPTVEEPASPEECTAVLGNNLEDSILDFEDDGEITTIRLNTEELTRNLQMFMQRDSAIQEDPTSKALVALPPGAASVPVPPLKSHTRLRTEHLVYEIPQGHPLLDGLDKLEPDDPCQYLLAIWNPGEMATSIRPPEGGCTSQDGQLCEEPSCVTCGSIREVNLQIVRGTILIPCRTAMRGSFPLNGTYFQVNEVFADHESSLNPLNVPRSLIWNLPRRTVYCGTSISAIFKGMSAEAIRHCFWRGYLCVRGFDRKTRVPCPLVDRIHFPASKMAEAKDKDKHKVRAL